MRTATSTGHRRRLALARAFPALLGHFAPFPRLSPASPLAPASCPPSRPVCSNSRPSVRSSPRPVGFNPRAVFLLSLRPHAPHPSPSPLPPTHSTPYHHPPLPPIMQPIPKERVRVGPGRSASHSPSGRPRRRPFASARAAPLDSLALGPTDQPGCRRPRHRPPFLSLPHGPALSPAAFSLASSAMPADRRKSSSGQPDPANDRPLTARSVPPLARQPDRRPLPASSQLTC